MFQMLCYCWENNVILGQTVMKIVSESLLCILSTGGVLAQLLCLIVGTTFPKILRELTEEKNNQKSTEDISTSFF